MRFHAAVVTFAALLAAGVALTGCDPNTTAHAGGTSSPAAAASGTTAAAAQAPVPALTGLGLQTAQDMAQAAGFRNLTSHDSSGAGRMQIIDRNWKVCTQAPAAGTTATSDVKIDLGAVKLDESCPDDVTSSPSPTATATPAPSTPAPTTHPPTRKPIVRHTATTHSGTSGSGGSGGSSLPTGSTSHHTEAPVAPGGGATARCNDGTLSYSQHHRGTCSHHGGVAIWYK
ncbi:DUF3761 domain-containing protein [Streptomyces sp. HPF1205]|uniref:DUF3761 domain-containing protein n=1 Tax=Streptomyces sp. HPF1205 TaxID=2873262 RepID=UPI001CECD907|nr:DUF3761 domain-containing protein [Streptomyces sp. HPF1205]